jgi:hypothetical protein
MVRVGLAALGLAGASGCSLLLDFGAVPPDAPPYSQAECDYKEPNNTLAEAAAFEATDVGPAAICAGEPDDRDFYRFTVPAGTASVRVQVTFTNRPGGDLDLRLTDPTGATTFGQSRGFGDVELLVCPGSSPVCPMLAEGDYVFEVFPATPHAVNRYDLALTLTPM